LQDYKNLRCKLPERQQSVHRLLAGDPLGFDQDHILWNALSLMAFFLMRFVPAPISLNDKFYI
jgi:hypothetical protein